MCIIWIIKISHLIRIASGDRELRWYLNDKEYGMRISSANGRSVTI